MNLLLDGGVDLVSVLRQDDYIESGAYLLLLVDHFPCGFQLLEAGVRALHTSARRILQTYLSDAAVAVLVADERTVVQERNSYKSH